MLFRSLLQRRGGPDFPVEPFDAQPLRELGREDLHDDGAFERDVVRKEDPAHATAAELALEAVRRAQCVLELVAKVGVQEALDRGKERAEPTWAWAAGPASLGGRWDGGDSGGGPRCRGISHFGQEVPAQAHEVPMGPTASPRWPHST